MHPLENTLIQLQELTLIRDEQKVMGHGHLEELDASVKGMMAELPPNIRLHYERLHSKDHVVVAPVAVEVCSVCGMKLPISLVQAIRIGREIYSCPNCARLMYYPESAPRRTGTRSRRMGEEKIGISRFSSSSLMLPKLESEDVEGCIRELAFKMEAEGFVDQAPRLVELAMRREAIVGTGVEHGVAFPHVRGVEGGGLTLALGLSKKGIRFSEGVKNLSRIVFFIVIPTVASAFYLKLVAGLASTFLEPEARKALLAEKEPEKLWKTLVKITRPTIK